MALLGIGLGIAFIASLAVAGSGWTTGPLAQAQGNDVDYETELQKGLDLLRRRRYEEALKSFKRANEMRDSGEDRASLLSSSFSSRAA